MEFIFFIGGHNHNKDDMVLMVDPEGKLKYLLDKFVDESRNRSYIDVKKKTAWADVSKFDDVKMKCRNSMIWTV